MKEKYIKPELETKPYAQFESVFAGCNKNKVPCTVDGSPGDGPSYSSHVKLGG